ncbi:TlpA family protein disulfide reductase, partial [bacterium]|nr:TlpA family protein disulfide reductase [bacterium]
MVGALLVVLYFLEPVVKSSRFVFKAPTSEPSQYPVFTTEDSFAVVSPGPLKPLRASQKIRLKDLLEAPETAGRPVLINFWATWCEPCIEEIPTLNVLTRQL